MKLIKLRKGKQRLAINQFGGGLVSYQIDKINLLLSYQKNITDKVGSMGDVLFPFPGRVKNSVYEFKGKKYILKNTLKIDGHSIHGFVTDKRWHIDKKGDDFVELSYRIEKDKYLKNGFPFSLEIKVRYILIKKGIKVISEVFNFGKEEAPFGLGFHPYFTVGVKKVDDISLKINAKKLVEFDRSLMPSGRLIKLRNQKLDYNKAKTINKDIIDNCFTDLIYKNNVCQTELISDKAKIMVWQDRGFDFLQMYSADTIGQKYMRAGLAVEPQTCCGFAFNKPQMGLKILKANEKYLASWGVNII